MRVLTVFLFAGSLFGQRLLYNETLDKQGQDAAAAAKAVASAPITAKELQNMTIIEKQEIDGTLQAGYLTMRTEVQAFSTWEILSRSVCKNLRMIYAKDEIQALLINALVTSHAVFDPTCKVSALSEEKAAFEDRTKALPAASADAMKTLNEQAAQIQQKVSTLAATAQASSSSATKSTAKPAAGAKAPSAEDTTQTWIKAATDRVGDVQQLLKFASSIDAKIKTDGQVKALQQVQDGLKQLATLIDTVNGIWKTYQGVAVDPRSLAPSKEKLAASLLSVDADRLKEETAIRARNALYVDDLRKRLEDCVALLDHLKLWYSPIEVEESLNAASTTKSDGVNMILALHLATAGAVANELPNDVVLLRESIAERRAAVRRDAVYNGAYETALQAAGQRLAAYYGAGVKPSQVAALLYYLSGIVTLPKLAF